MRPAARLADVVKTTCFLADINDFAAFNAVYAPLLAGPAAGPLHVRRRRAAERCARSRSRPSRAHPWVRTERRPVVGGPRTRIRLTPSRGPPENARVTASRTEPSSRTAAVVLAAGLGTRMRSRTPEDPPSAVRAADARLRPRRLGRGAAELDGTGRAAAPSSCTRPRPRRSATSSASAAGSRSRTSRAAPATRSAPRSTKLPDDGQGDPRPLGDVPLVIGDAARGDRRAAPPRRRGDHPRLGVCRRPGRARRVVRSEFGSVERIVEARDATRRSSRPTRSTPASTRSMRPGSGAGSTRSRRRRRTASCT